MQTAKSETFPLESNVSEHFCSFLFLYFTHFFGGMSMSYGYETKFHRALKTLQHHEISRNFHAKLREFFLEIFY